MNAWLSAIRLAPSLKTYFVTPTSMPTARPTPTAETMTISRTNGIRIVQFDAPTSRMIPISRRRMNAA